MADNKGAAIIKRADALRTIRLPQEQPWRDVFDYSFPSRVDGFDGEVRDATNTQDQLARLTDSTLAESAQILTSNIQAGMTPANAVWTGFQTPQQSQEESLWFDACATTIWQHIHASNFDAEDYEATLEMVLAGWGVLFIDEDRDAGGYVFQWWPISGCYIAQSKPGGKVDTIYRPYKLTAEQAVNQFSLRGDQLSDAVRECAMKKPDELIEFVQAIYPRKGGVQGAAMARNLPFASCHVERKTAKLVRESGFHEQPFTCFRWSVLPNLPYGMGPASVALPDAKMLNGVKRLEYQNLDMAVAGMWIAEDDGVLNPRNVKVGARKIIVANSVDSMKALQPATNFQIAFMSEEKLQAQIKRVMMADHLTPREGPVETAAAVYERISLLRQLLGPLYGRLQSEKLKTLVERCFGIAMRAGVLPPMPESLQGKQATVSYRSPFARAQKMEEVAAIERAWMSAGQIAVAKQDPGAMDNLDADASVIEITKAVGAEKILRDPKVVALIRKQREDAQQAAKQQEMAQPIVQEAGKALAQNMVNA